MVDLNAVNVTINFNTTLQRSLIWRNLLESTLNEKGDYVFINDESLVGLYICIFSKQSFKINLNDIRTSTIGVGIMGRMGNKGAVSIRLSAYDSTICFVCSHLAAHMEHINERNSDVRNITERLTFTSSKEKSDFENNYLINNNTSINKCILNINSLIMPTQDATQFLTKDLKIPEHDLIFWFGDLNYRIMPKEGEDFFSIRDKIRAKKLDDLLEQDQLNIERLEGRIFQNFYEEKISFQPTYKYLPGTHDYDDRKDKKLRIPAWCDRVLYRELNDRTKVLKSYEYSACMANKSPYDISDHKPVRFNSLVKLKKIEKKKEIEIYNKYLQTLEKFAKNLKISFNVSSSKIHFEKVRYNIEQTYSLMLKNESNDSICFWSFLNKEIENSPCKRWIKLSKTYGLLLPNESFELKVTINVDRLTSQALLNGQEILEDLLILRVEGFGEYYIKVTGNYIASCFGFPLQTLLSIPGPVSAFPLASTNPLYYLNLGLLKQSCNSIEDLDNKIGSTSSELLSSSGSILQIPKEFWRLIDALQGEGQLSDGESTNHVCVLTTPELFQSITPTLAHKKEVEKIRECLDDNIPFHSPLSPYALIDTLFEFLHALPQPVIPYELINNIYKQSANGSAPITSSILSQFLLNLPPANYNITIYFISFLKHALEYHQYNNSNINSLAYICVKYLTNCLVDSTSANESTTTLSTNTTNGEEVVEEVSSENLGRIDSDLSFYTNYLIHMSQEDRLKRQKKLEFLLLIFKNLLA